MNTKLNLSILLFAVLAFSAVAAGKPQSALTVAIYGFTDADKNSGGYGSKVTTLLTADLTVETNLVMVERADLKKALGEQALGNSGMVSSATAARIGQITGAKVLVSGQVIRTGKNHLIVVANIIGTETGRLFAAKAEGATEDLMDLTSDLSGKIAQKIRDQAANFVTESKSHEDYLDRIAKSVTGTNRPTVSVNIHWPQGISASCTAANTEMGVILQKAGFVVVDEHSERKPDVEITGLIQHDERPRRGQLFSWHAVVDVKVQERRTGKIIAFDHQTADAVDVGKIAARKSVEVIVIDGLAERIVPLLAK